MDCLGGVYAGGPDRGSAGVVLHHVLELQHRPHAGTTTRSPSLRPPARDRDRVFERFTVSVSDSELGGARFEVRLARA